MRMNVFLARRRDCHLPLALAVVCASLALVADARPPFSRERFMAHVEHLASDAMDGRGNGTPGIERAAAYLASEFAGYGLEPGARPSSFFQNFEITVDAELGSLNQLRLDGVRQSYLGDFVTIPLSASGTYTGPAVFAGYGLTAPELRWDDYAGVDVSGKAVVVFLHDPWERMPATSPAGLRAAIEMKARNAKQHGALAVLFVLDPNNHPREDALIEIGTTAHDSGVLAMLVTRRAIDPLFRPMGRSVAAAQQRIDAAMRPRSFALADASVSLVTDVRRVTRPAANVLAAIPGSDPRLRHEWLVIGAHYDHLGRDDVGGEAYRGADDNASGTAGMLEVARAFQARRDTLKRSVMFVGFAAEEIGLLGSSHFVDHPPVPLGSIVGMLNLDMIGRVSDGLLNIIGSGLHPDLARWVRQENLDVGLTLAFSNGAREASDWAPFRFAGVPALSFFSGSHGDYHQRSDTPDKIDVAGALRVLEIVHGTAERLATTPSVSAFAKPTLWTPGDDDRLPYFGSEPMLDAESGLLIFERVRHGSPAARAGVRAGDELMELAEYPPRSVAEFRSTLLSLRPGDMTSVAVRRAGRVHRLMVTLGAL